ncbi:MAG: hypothetical protein AzoDbin1_03414 [Azoarcus sp.]|uniref:Uncharacterized protein n=1 Tax=Aromatoleum tolulyticum TaxID=34027 RepID=A0A1N7AWL1_9RHOO|nr:hypothetical protein [Aromatoleum tolulyticum]MCK9986942.1 hypothetical protein [Azoarcus sp.]SIR43490.1 hypothetical protein SAMN05421829_11586 [Aromatoleum tolulyticum]
MQTPFHSARSVARFSPPHNVKLVPSADRPDQMNRAANDASALKGGTVAHRASSAYGPPA